MWDGDCEAEMAASTASAVPAAGMEAPRKHGGAVGPGASRDEIPPRGRGTRPHVHPPWAGKLQGRDGGFKAVMLERTKGSKSPSRMTHLESSKS